MESCLLNAVASSEKLDLYVPMMKRHFESVMNSAMDWIMESLMLRLESIWDVFDWSKHIVLILSSLHFCIKVCLDGR